MKLTYNLLTNISKNITIGLALGLSLLAPKIMLANPLPLPSNSILNNGIYLYGKSPIRYQLGVEYLIFLVQNTKLVGAFYQVSSEFNCFYGNINQDKLSLSIIDPYDNTVYPYSIALENSSPLASEGDHLIKNLELSGYYSIKNHDIQDLQILNICQQELTEKI